MNRHGLYAVLIAWMFVLTLIVALYAVHHYPKVVTGTAVIVFGMILTFSAYQIGKT